MSRNVEHFFLYFLVIWISSFEKTIQFIWLFLRWVNDIFGDFSFLSSLYILDINPLSDIADKDLEIIYFVVQSFLTSCSPFFNSFSWLQSHLSSIEEVIVYAY
jgi:hypothetical protein